MGRLGFCWGARSVTIMLLRIENLKFKKQIYETQTSGYFINRITGRHGYLLQLFGI